MKSSVICLAAGQGKRMNSEVKKQYLLLDDKPLLYYCLKEFEQSDIEDIILVVGEGEIEYCQNEIVDFFQFKKVVHIIEGGKERYHSVMKGLKKVSKDTDYVLIHDGARPFVDQDIIQRGINCAVAFGTAIAGMPVKDTIKIASRDGVIESTPPRDFVWTIQTPQIFEYNIIISAYEILEEKEKKCSLEKNFITDDAMVVETFLEKKVRLFSASYENIKITTPEDMRVAEVFLKK